MRANIGRRSNVVVISEERYWDTPSFRAQVRGRSALLKWLEKKAPGASLTDAVYHYLSPRQRADVAWETPCEICGARPEGPVRRGQTVEVEFRCPRGTCRASHHAARTVLVNIDLVNEALARAQTDPSTLVQRVLSRSFNPSGRRPTGRLVPLPVRLTRSQYLALRHHTDGELAGVFHAALLSWMKAHG
jgi:hypothetical protein